MANTLLTLGAITREAVRLWRNTNAFLMNIDRQYDDQYAREGAKAGTTIRIRLPNDYVIRTGATYVQQSTGEQSISMTLATQMGVDVGFTSAEKTLSLDDFSERILAPAVNTTAGGVAATIMSGVEGGVCNFVANQGTNLATLTPNATTVLNAGATLGINSAGGNGNRWLIADPFTMARSVSSLSGLFNPAPEISRQYRDAQIYNALGFKWADDQTVIKHQTGTFTSGTVNGAGQTGQTLVTNAITGTLNKGDIITIAGVYGINRITKQSTGQLRQFVVTASVASGATAISVYPAIIGSTSGVAGGPAQPFQTTDSSPANGAAIALVNLAGEVYRKNIAFAPDAVTMATADLYRPTKGVVDSAREVYDKTSIRMITFYDGVADNENTRLDVLFGYLYTRPEWLVIIADAV